MDEIEEIKRGIKDIRKAEDVDDLASKVAYVLDLIVEKLEKE